MPGWLWLAIATCIACAPFLRALSTTRLFYIRDLSLYFWSRYLWLRRTMLDGEWPLWDPYVGGGQSAVADALHQMFLLPVLAVRLIGNEVLGFNLWVALPFPFAAVGAWLFLASRFSAQAAALGAMAFALSGPIVSTGNFPNMSWSVAAMPWVLWAADRVAAVPGGRRTAILALVVAFQALAGEPVTFSATAALVVGFAFFVPSAPDDASIAQRARRVPWVVAGLGLGAALAAVQLVPMVHAAAIAERSKTIVTDVWSLHPMALVETVALHFFGDYFALQSLSGAPWMPLVNTGREPFFFSIYFGVPLFALTLFGLVALGRNSWGIFWAAAGGASIVLAFGVYTPVYPFLRDHVPVVASFRFPVKYLVVFSMAVASGAAAGWDALRRTGTFRDAPSVFTRARVDATGFALLVAAIAGGFAAAGAHAPEWTASRASAAARALGARDGEPAGSFMARSLPRAGVTVVPVAVAGAVLVLLATGRRRSAPLARHGLYALIAGDLVIRAWGINPVFDAAYLAEPEWLSRTKADPNARFYVGGKKDGTLDSWDPDSSRGFFNPRGLVGSASRAALSGQTAFYPSAWHGREMLSYDLALLWPKRFDLATERFFESEREARDLFLDRTGVRYRVLPDRLSSNHVPLIKIPYYSESFLYDWGAAAAPRVSVVSSAIVVHDPRQQIERLFQPGWSTRDAVVIEHEPNLAGEPNERGGGSPFARIVADHANRVVIEAGISAPEGYLVLLDSYSEDWQATIDGQPAEIARANALFRAVRLPAGRHVVEFAYRPRAFLWGAAISAIGLLAIAALRVLGPQSSAVEIAKARWPSSSPDEPRALPELR